MPQATQAFPYGQTLVEEKDQPRSKGCAGKHLRMRIVAGANPLILCKAFIALTRAIERRKLTYAELRLEGV